MKISSPYSSTPGASPELFGDEEDRARVLNVEDFEPARFLRSKVLRSAGFDIVEAGTAGEARRWQRWVYGSRPTGMNVGPAKAGERDAMHLRIGAPDRRSVTRGTPDAPTRQDLKRMIVGMYREMPGLTLRVEQAARLVGLSPATCRIVFEDLVRRGALGKDLREQYVKGHCS